MTAQEHLRLDRFIAAVVIGEKPPERYIRPQPDKMPRYWRTPSGYKWKCWPAHYSTDIAAAWLVVNRLLAIPLLLVLFQCEKQWRCAFRSPSQPEEEEGLAWMWSKKAAAAICLAAERRIKEGLPECE